jgi:AP-4 complex subunit mu-1
MKSYLLGNPELRLVLNDDLIVGRANNMGQHLGAVVLDDCNFHECVDLRDFESMKTLTINPPDGEFLVMNYRINGDY